MPHAAAWRPGIGDPTAVGWATVVFYLIAALLSVQAARQTPASANGARRWWYGLALMLLALGLNKQLDLQSLLTAVGRDVAVAQGWYEQRKRVQLVFVAIVALGGIGAIGLIAATLARRAGWPLRAAVLAAGVLVVFIIVRAASFHHVDAMLHLPATAGGLNIFLEVGPLLVIMLAAWQASRSRERRT
jgi:hypothetical protein